MLILIEITTTPPSIVSEGGVAGGGGILSSRKTIAWNEVTRADCIMNRSHKISNVRVMGQEGDVHIVKSNYVVLQTMQGEETKVFNAGQYVDKINFGNGTTKFQEKLVIYDTIQIPGLLVVPI